MGGRPAHNSSGGNGDSSSSSRISSGLRSPPPQHKSYNTLAPPQTARAASEEQRQAERSSLLRRLSSGSNSSLLQLRRSADDDFYPPLASPYTPAADYKTMAMEMAYLTPRRKPPSSVRLAGSPSRHRGLFSGAGSEGAPYPPQHSPVFPPAITSGVLVSPPSDIDAPEQLGGGFFRAGSTTGEHDTLLLEGSRRGSSSGNPGVLTLALFAASILFLFADQNLLAPNLTVRALMRRT